MASSSSSASSSGGPQTSKSKASASTKSSEQTEKSIPDPKTRYGGDSGRQSGDSWPYWLRFSIGVITTINFVIFWGLPIFGMGYSWHAFLRPFLQPIYNWMERHPKLRKFAADYIYQREIHADYFAQSILVLSSWLPPLLYLIYVQRTEGSLAWWQIYFYYCMWVGIRGGTLGGAYSLAHREGHNPNFYKPAVANTVGNIFENVIGPFFGNVPWNFTTSHIYLHHYLQGGSQDSFYQFDMDRTSWKDFMIFLHRIILHTTGFSSVIIMHSRGLTEQWVKLARGIFSYFIIYPALILFATKWSWSFLFYIYLQPFVGMTFFLAFMNYAFHAFVDYDEEGNTIPCVNATCIVDGNDDYFGEDDHMAHHYATHVYWRDLPAYRKTKVAQFAKYNAMVFHTVSITELAALILFKQWDRLADHYVQFNDDPAPNKLPEDELIRQGSVDLTGTTKASVWMNTGRLTRKEVIAMLKQRAVRREPIDV